MRLFSFPLSALGCPGSPYICLWRTFFSFSARAVRALTKKIYDGARASILRKKRKLAKYVKRAIAMAPVFLGA